MNQDTILYFIIGCFGIFVFAIMSVIVKGLYSKWIDYRSKIELAKKKRGF